MTEKTYPTRLVGATAPEMEGRRPRGQRIQNPHQQGLLRKMESALFLPPRLHLCLSYGNHRILRPCRQIQRIGL